LLVLAQSTSGPLWPLAVYAGSVVFMVAAMLAASWLLGERHRQRTTHEPYEFYPVAALFVIFDLEAVLFVAWAIAARPAGWAGFVEILIVAVVLLAALAYLWRQGALDWATTIRRQRRRGAEGEEKDEY
jgi:NADH-quinone oxidoreductase subunit A